MTKSRKPKRTQVKDLSFPEQELTSAETSEVKGGKWWGITHGAASAANLATTTPPSTTSNPAPPPDKALDKAYPHTEVAK